MPVPADKSLSDDQFEKITECILRNSDAEKQDVIDVMSDLKSGKIVSSLDITVTADDFDFRKELHALGMQAERSYVIYCVA